MDRKETLNHVVEHWKTIYGDTATGAKAEEFAGKMLEIMRLDNVVPVNPAVNNWSEKDVVLITYGDSILSENARPLHQLHKFLDDHCAGLINSVHILPFFPYSSDDGFSVIDYFAVDKNLGTWEDIEKIARSYRLMADLVINHCSSESEWFRNFVDGSGEGSDFFLTATEDHDYSQVVRPRTTPLLREVTTGKGKQHVWCTFSHDQVDFDFSKPEVLLTFLKIIRFYLDKGVRLFRLDAVAFLWKEAGTGCINLPQTHEVIRLLRHLIECAQGDSVVITETNIPTMENLSYFGEADEANWVYNFPLPPLLIHTFLCGDCRVLRQWSKGMPPAENGTAYFNFIASHDGIGVRPVEGLLDDEQLFAMVAAMEKFGGKISWRSVEGGAKPYEINIALFDAFKGTFDEPDDQEHCLNRFLCAHTIMFGLEGIPGLYIHSLLGTGNDYETLAITGQNRSINRHKWEMKRLEAALADPDLSHGRVIAQLKKLLSIRISQPAFHPNATQFTLSLGPHLFGVWRQSIDRKQSIFAVSNVSATPVELDLMDINLIGFQQWHDLISGDPVYADSKAVCLKPYQSVWITNKVTNIS